MNNSLNTPSITQYIKKNKNKKISLSLPLYIGYGYGGRGCRFDNQPKKKKKTHLLSLA